MSVRVQVVITVLLYARSIVENGTDHVFTVALEREKNMQTRAKYTNENAKSDTRDW